MTAKQRIQRLEKTAPKDKSQVNPYMAMSDKELLQIAKDIAENNTDDTSEVTMQAKRILTNNGIAWTVKP